MKAGRITETAMAARLGTSRSQLDRLLNPQNVTVQLDTITPLSARGREAAADRDG